MDNIHIAKVYAEALLGLGVEQNKLEQYEDELITLTDSIVKDEAVFTFFVSPKISKQDKLKVVEGLRNTFSESIVSFVGLLVKNERIIYIKDVLAQFIEGYDRHLGRRRAQVYSAKPLDSTQLQEITSILNNKISGKCILENKIKPELIGGFVIKFDDKVIDGSIRNHLDRLKKSLLLKKLQDRNLYED